MFNKVTTFSIEFKGLEILDSDFVKTASEIILPEGHNYDPDFLYMKVRAVSAGEYYGCNKNADHFPEEELKKSYKTFLDAHVFKNHENKNVENAIGDVLDAIWNDKMKYVELLIRVDKNIAPSIVRGFEKGFMTDVSMGCKIKHSVCSVCGNIARTQKEYCEHIKYNKHQVYDDGRKVYEINIGPKFHDISAVLNGADRTAKMTGLFIMNGKVAFMEDKEEFKKTASLQEEISSSYELSKVASENINIDTEDLNIFKSKLDIESLASEKEKYMQKIADMKKEIEGKVLAVAKGRYINDTFSNLDEIVDIIKMFYTDFLTKKECSDIADKLKAISVSSEIPIEQVFDRLIKMLGVAGVELSSLEFDWILNSLIGEDSDLEENIKESLKTISPESIYKVKKSHDIVLDEYNDEINMPTLFNLFDSFSKIKDSTTNIPGLTSRDNSKVISIIIRKAPKIERPVLDVPEIEPDILRVIKGIIPSRSCHRSHLIPRLLNIIKSDSAPNMENIRHFAIPIMSKTASENTSISVGVSSLLYSYYQNDRLKFAFSEDYNDDLVKYASEIGLEEFDKVAGMLGKGYTTRKAIILGLPLTFGYSAAQRSRMRNGKEVSDFNRYVAENPANAYVLQLAGPSILKGVKKIPRSTIRGIKNIPENIKNGLKMIKSAQEDHMILLTKQASECLDAYIDRNDNIDMFANKDIDDILKKDYTDSQISIIKAATVMYGLGREDTCDELLEKEALCQEDISKYLQISESCFKINIEKTANTKDNMKDLGISVVQDMLFTNPATTMLTSLPGHILDGAVITGLSRKAKKDQERQMKENTNNFDETQL